MAFGGAKLIAVGSPGGVWLAAVALLALTGCAAQPPAAPTAPVVAPVAEGSSPHDVPHEVVPPGQLRIGGAVRQTGTWSSARLAALPGQTVAISFRTEKGTERHTETGVALSAVLDRVGLATVAGTKHDELSIGVLAVGADGYSALVSYGELAPAFGNRGVLLATIQDGVPLPRPRLVVPGDVKGGRDVNDLVELRVVNLGPAG